MATWNINPYNDGATLDNNGVFSASPNTSDAVRHWDITYTDNEGNTATTRISQDACSETCGSGITVIQDELVHHAYSIETDVSGFDYKVTFSADTRNNYGIQKFFVEVPALIDGECIYDDPPLIELEEDYNNCRGCIYADVGSDSISDIDTSISIEIEQWGPGTPYCSESGNTRQAVLNITNTNPSNSGTSKILVETHNTTKTVDVEITFSGNGWSSIKSITERNYGFGTNGVIFQSSPKYQARAYVPAISDENKNYCLGFYGFIPYQVTALNGPLRFVLDQNREGDLHKRLNIEWPTDTSIANLEWQDLKLTYLANPDTAITVDNMVDGWIAPCAGLEIGHDIPSSGRYMYAKDYSQQGGTSPATNIPNWSFPGENNKFWNAWGQEYPVGQGWVYAIFAEMPKDPSTDKLKIMYYLQYN